MDRPEYTERRVVFEERMSRLHERLQQMGSLVEGAIARSIESLKKQDLVMAKAVIDGDDLLDELQQEIEEKCLEVIATQQPMAKDLRRIFTLFKITNDLERMGDTRPASPK